MLLACPRCDGFIPERLAACPHCARPLRGRLRRLAVGAAAGGAFLMTLAACYGAPKRDHCDPKDDKDKDGYCAKDDCDDDNVAIYAGCVRDAAPKPTTP